MKKMLLLAAMAVFAIPAFADDCDGKECHKKRGFDGRAAVMQQDPEFMAKMQAKKAEMKARKEAFEQKEDRLEKLVEKYKKAKAGSKKQAELRKEIGQELESVREDQLKMRAEKLAGFEKRMATMKEELAKEQSADGKQKWIEKMTDLVIAEDGDLGDALEKEGRIHKGNIGPKAKDGKCPYAKKGKCPHAKDGKCPGKGGKIGGHRGSRVELPVEPKPMPEVK